MSGHNLAGTPPQQSGAPVQGPTGNGGAFPSSAKVFYREDPCTSLRVTLIRTWKRGEIPGYVMSASSGPKAYVRNYIFQAFESDPGIVAVHMVRGQYSHIGDDKHHSPPFLLVSNGAGQFFDLAGLEVAVEP